MKDLKSYLGVGNINEKSNGTCVYYIRSLNEISILTNHFDKYPLITKKHADYLLFKSALDILKKKQHLTDRKSTRLNSSHSGESRMPSSA